LDSNPEIAARIEGRLERLGLAVEDAERIAGLPAGSLQALLHGEGALPRGAALRRLAATLDVEEGFLLGLEPGDLIPAEMLEDPQAELGLLAPDEEALLRHYRRLDIPARAAVNLLLARAAAAAPAPAEPPPRKAAPRRGQAGLDLG
jgi:transcriptional regulator with XRE-family HTH domain